MALAFGFSLQGRGALADREAITALARRADSLGFDSIWVTDRLLIPVRQTSPYPYADTGAFPLGPDEPWLEPLAAITYLCAVTRRIAVGPSVLVIPYRNPVVVAKALATADYLSGGRIILGAGAGWWREEFAALGVPFEERADRMVEYLRLMKEIWTRPRIAFAGRFVHIAEAGGVRPHPASQPHIPIWIGGHSEAALRRVVEIGDGWHPIGLRPPVSLLPAEMAAKVKRLRDLAAARGRDPASLTISFKAPLRMGGAAPLGASPRAPFSGSSAQVVEDIQAYAAAGVEHFVFDFTATTLPAMLDVLQWFADEVRPRVTGSV